MDRQALHMRSPSIARPNFQAAPAGGFTLVEILIALLLGGAVMAAIMSSFHVQHRTYLAQDEVVIMQQNARLAMDMLARDIRMAGYSPTGNRDDFTFVNNTQFSNAAGTILTTVNTNSSAIAFRADLNGNGVVDLSVIDANNDGVIDMSDMEQIAFRLNNNNTLQRYSSVTGFITWQAIAEDIEAIEFNYILEQGGRTTAPLQAELDQIRAVQVSVLTRTPLPDRNYVDSKTYTAGSGATWGPFNDGFRRQLLTQTVICRNMGLR